MNDTLVLGIDCGTQSLRAGLYRTADGMLLAQTNRAYPTRYPHVNWAEQNPEDWWRAMVSAVPECLQQAGVSGQNVAALACDGTSCTAVFCDEDAVPLRPAILWMDLRAAAEAKRIEETRHPVLDHCGRRISAEWMLPKALWTFEHEPDVFRRAHRIVEGADWLTYRLTGTWSTSTGNASGKRHWTPRAGWPLDFYAALGLSSLAEKSPDEVVYVGQPVGSLLPAAAEALGLSNRCVVAHGGMDGWSSPIGSNCFTEGTASLTLGTSNVLILETGEPRLIDGVMGPFPDGIRKGYSVYEAGQASGGSIIGWLLSLMGIAGDEEALRALETESAKIGPGSCGLAVFDAWRGNRTPHFDARARGTICGLTLEHGPAHVYRAVLEGCAYGIRTVADVLETGGRPVSEVRVCGTGAGNRLWTRIIAGVLEKPLFVSAERQATCLGTAIGAAVACGSHASLIEAASAMAAPLERIEPELDTTAYEIGYHCYSETYSRMRDTMHRLADMT